MVFELSVSKKSNKGCDIHNYAVLVSVTVVIFLIIPASSVQYPPHEPIHHQISPSTRRYKSYCNSTTNELDYKNTYYVD